MIAAVLLLATGAWAQAPDYAININSPLTLFPNVQTPVVGTVTALNGYDTSNTVDFHSCGFFNYPYTCLWVGQLFPSVAGTPISMFVTASGGPADVPLTVTATGSDPLHITHSAPLVLNVVDFTLGALPANSASVNNGNSTSIMFTVGSGNNYAGALTLSCPGLPSNGVTCAFSGTGVSGNTLDLAAGATPTITATFLSTSGTGGSSSVPTSIQIDASTPSSRTKSAGTFTVNLTGNNGGSDVSVGPVAQSPVNTVTSAQTVTYTFAVTNNGPDSSHNTSITYNVPAGYTFVGTGSGPNCIGTTTIVCNAGTVASGASANITIMVTPGLVASQLMTFTGSADEPDSNPANNSGTAATNVKDFTVGLGTNAISIPQPPAGQSSSLTVPVTITGLNGFNSSTGLACVGQPAGVTCLFTPSSVTPTALGVNSTLKITAASTVAPKVYNLQVKGTAGTLIHTQPLAVTIGAPNFTQAVTPTTQNVTDGSSASYTVVYTALGGMTQDIAVGCGALPAGVTCTAVPAIVTPNVTPGNQSIVTLQTTAGSTLVANATVAIVGTSTSLNNLTRSTNVTLAVKDFSITANTATIATNVGSNITDTIVVKGLNGFTGTVALSCLIVGTPAGTNCTLSNVNPAASSTGTSVTATITSDATQTPQGTYTVQVTGTNSGQSKTASFTLNIKDFTLGLGSSEVTLPQPPSGQSSTITLPITVIALNSFNTSTALSCLGQPTGITCAFSPASGIPTAGVLHSTLTISGASAAAVGPHDITVKATAGTLIRQQTLEVDLWGPNFTEAVTPTTQNVTAGSSSAPYNVTFTPLGGMNDDIAVSCTGVPVNVTCTPVPAVVNPGTGYSSAITLGTVAGTAAANSTIAIVGTSSGISVTRFANIMLSVKNFSVTANTATVATNVGSNITDTILVKGLNGFTGNVALSCVIVGAPAGTNCTLSNVNPAATSTGASVTTTITSDPLQTPPGAYTVQVTGTSSGQQQMASFTVNIKEFALATGTGAITIPQPPPGQSSSLTIPVTLTALNSFNTSTSLGCTGQPTGVTCAFSPASGIPTSGGLASTLTITGASTAVLGDYPITVKATAGTLIRTQPLAVHLWGPNFTQAVTPATQNVTNGNSTTFTVRFTALGGMTDTITVGCGTLPAGVVCTPNPVQVIPGVTPNNQSVVTLQATAGTTPAANATVAITGVSPALNNLTRSTNVTLSVKDFKLQPATATISVNAGSNITDSISLQALNSFSGPLTLSCTVVGAPVGIGCTFPTTGSTGSSQTLTVTTTGPAVPGSYTVQVTGSNGGQSRTGNVTVNVKGIAIGAAPLVQSVPSNGGQANYTVTTTALNGFTGAVTLSCATPLPTGITCGFGSSNTTTLSVTPTVAGTTTNLRVTVANGTAVNQYNLAVKAALGTTLTPIAPIAINVGVPSILNLSQPMGAWGQTVIITGVAFNATPELNTVMFNGVQANVSLATPTSLTVQVPAGSTTGNVTVTTFATSNAVPFTVQNLTPTVTTVTPNALTVGAPATMITLSGSDFVPGAQVMLDGAIALDANFISPTQITATVPHAQALSAHVYSLTVFNPAPGGGTSSASSLVITSVNPATSTVVAAPTSNVLANNIASSTITVTVKTTAGTGISGQTVQLASTGSANTIVPASAITNGSGVATFTVKSTKAELKTISATVTLNPGGNLMSLNAQPTVGFVGDISTISASLSTAVAAPATGVLADGITQSAISVQLVDAFGNPVSGQTVSLSSSGSGNVLSAPTITDANGTHTGGIGSTTAETKTITITANPGAGQVVLTTHPTVTFIVPVARFVYIANAGDNTVSGYTVNVATGQLRHNGYALTGTSPVAVALDPSRRFVYIANSGSANVSAFSIANDGHLDAIGGSPFVVGSGPKALVVDRSGKFLYVANSTDGTISTLDIDPVTGALSSNSTIFAGSGPSAFFAEPRGKYLYAANSSGSIAAFAIDPLSGVLSTLGSSPFGAGAGPVALAGDRNAKFLYAVNNGTSDVWSYQIDLNTGALTNTGMIATGTGPTSAMVHPSGAFAYVTNSAGTVSMFSVDQADGHLTALGTPTVSAGNSPATIGIDLSGQYAFVGNAGSNDLSIFNVNRGTGQLTAVTATSATVRTRVAPWAIAIVSGIAPVSYAPKFAYVGQDSGNVSGFSINPSDGTLSSIGGVSGLSDARAITSDLRGKFVLVGIFSTAGSLRSYRVGDTGALSFVNPASAGNLPFAVAIEPSGRFAYVANKGSFNVSSFAMNATTGAVTRIANETATGTAARDITIDPTGRFLYTADDSNGKITAFRINSNGILSQAGSQMSLGGAFGVKTDPAGRFLYAVGSGTPSAAIYSINANDGSLSPAGSGPNVLSQPHSVEVSPNGRFAYAANVGVNTTSGFFVNLANGGLSSTNPGSFNTGNNSFQVRCDPTGQFLYVPNKLSGNVSIFTIDQATGSLTKVTDQAGISGPHQIAITGQIQ
ncbi:MAG: beta-propeller fold lactonase family protein [Terriglobales bacterium]